MAKKRRLPRPLPPPRHSARLYVRIAPVHVGMFRFLLEAEDNLAYATTVDRWASVLRVTFSPHQRGEVLRCLAAMQTRIPFTHIFDPDETPRATGTGQETPPATSPAGYTKDAPPLPDAIASQPQQECLLD